MMKGEEDARPFPKYQRRERLYQPRPEPTKKADDREPAIKVVNTPYGPLLAGSPEAAKKLGRRFR